MFLRTRAMRHVPDAPRDRPYWPPSFRIRKELPGGRKQVGVYRSKSDVDGVDEAVVGILTNGPNPKRLAVFTLEEIRELRKIEQQLTRYMHVMKAAAEDNAHAADTNRRGYDEALRLRQEADISTRKLEDDQSLGSDRGGMETFWGLPNQLDQERIIERKMVASMRREADKEQSKDWRGKK